MQRSFLNVVLLGGWITDIIGDFEGNRDRVTTEVQELCAAYPIY